MNFKVIEKILVGKKNNETCEDNFFINENFACVIDGATSKSNLTFKGLSQGQLAGNLIIEVIKDLDYSSSIEKFISYVNNKFSKFYKNQGLLEHMKKNPVDRLSASVAIFNHKLKEIWIIGDCQVIANEELYCPGKKIDTLLSDLRAFYIELELCKKNISTQDLLDDDISRKKIIPLLREQYSFQNNYFSDTYSYGVLDGFDVNKNGIVIIKVKSNEIILATDGYPQIFDSLEKSEDHLRMILKEDPLCYKIFKTTKGLQKGLKSFDDRAYLKIQVSNSS